MSARTMRSEPHDLAAVILVGGRSSRMGRPKPWLELAGRPLLARVVAQVRPWAHDIVLVAAPGQEIPPVDDDSPDSEGSPSIVIVRDDHPGQGPLPALALGLATTSAPWALALGCDAPLVRQTIVTHLAEARAPELDAIIPLWDGQPQPLVALYQRALAPALAALVAAGERRLGAIVDLPRVHLVASEFFRRLDPDGESFRSVNTPDEYAAAAAIWARRRPTPL